MEELLSGLLSPFVEYLGPIVLGEPFAKSPRPILASFGWAFYGLMGGLISLLTLPGHLFVDHTMRVVCLLCGPFACGLLMALTKIWSRRRISAAERFTYGYFFAVAAMAVRFAHLQ